MYGRNTHAHTFTFIPRFNTHSFQSPLIKILNHVLKIDFKVNISTVINNTDGFSISPILIEFPILLHL